MNLLLIDDDEIDRAAIIRALDQSSLAFKVMEANCARVAWSSPASSVSTAYCSTICCPMPMAWKY